MIQDFINMYIVFAISLATLGYLIPYTYDFVMKLKENKNKEKIFLDASYYYEIRKHVNNSDHLREYYMIYYSKDGKKWKCFASRYNSIIDAKIARETIIGNNTVVEKWSPAMPCTIDADGDVCG